MKQSYYERELEILKPDILYYQNIVISDSQGNKTKHISITDESIPVLIKFLENELNRLKTLKKD